jgi:uncharacterized protein (DUF488 family)
MILMTIGYEGLDIQTFIAELKTNGVTTLIDVRELPLSRKKNFSKSALSAAIRKAGIAYVHMPALGCPRDVRKEYYIDADWSRYRRRFNLYLQTQHDALVELRKASKVQSCCLMCFEADYRSCHRSLITEAMVRDCKITINHLIVRKPAQSVDQALACA